MQVLPFPSSHVSPSFADPRNLPINGNFAARADIVHAPQERYARKQCEKESAFKLHAIQQSVHFEEIKSGTGISTGGISAKVGGGCYSCNTHNKLAIVGEGSK